MRYYLHMLALFSCVIRNILSKMHKYDTLTIFPIRQIGNLFILSSKSSLDTTSHWLTETAKTKDLNEPVEGSAR